MADTLTAREAALGRARALNAVADFDLAGLDVPGPLVTVKDNIAVAGLRWTAGTPLFAGMIATDDATAVRLLRAAGASVAVKTTLHELALGITGTNAWSGAIANPIKHDRIAGGSSGGSAAALGVGLGDLSLVTDTGGSARIPAALCGVAGFRPTIGRYPMDGVVGLSPSRDTIGLMARDVATMRWADTILSSQPARDAAVDAGITIGILDAAALHDVSSACTAAYHRACDCLAKRGYRLMTVDLSEVEAAEARCGFIVAFYETEQTLRRTVPALCGRSFEDLVAAVASPDVRELLMGRVDGVEYARAIGHDWPALKASYAALFTGVQALLTPTLPVTAPPIGATTVMLGDVAKPIFPALTHFTRADSMAGLPSVTVPAGRDEAGLPIGVMLTAPWRNDAALLALAEQLAAALE